MTSVLGHLTASDFGPEFKGWQYPPPDRLFDAPIFHGVAKVCLAFLGWCEKARRRGEYHVQEAS